VGSAQRVLAEVVAAGNTVAVPVGEGADDLFKSAIQVLTEVKNDLELARSYRAFAAYREKNGYPTEAVQLRMKADEIFGRLRGAAKG
jgi:hypothetical protein